MRCCGLGVGGWVGGWVVCIPVQEAPAAEHGELLPPGDEVGLFLLLLLSPLPPFSYPLLLLLLLPSPSSPPPPPAVGRGGWMRLLSLGQ